MAVGIVKKKRRLVIAGVVLLYLLSLPPVAYLLDRSLEVPPDSFEGAQAIVVLGGGAVENAPEYGGGPEVTTSSLARVRYAARLHRQNGLPLLMAGGRHEAEVMARLAQRDFGVSGEVWQEDRSLDTHENAEFSAPILREHGVKTILLVSEATHLRRARHAFQRLGFEVRCAPTGMASHGPWSDGIFLILPASDSLCVSSRALEEWLGVLYYRLRWG